ncbi:MAG: hypothetical protein IJK38_09675 [Oscillospiraceae bacterium]|nr:hypothetical protein [Oscillospiraceae bacterium]
MLEHISVEDYGFTVPDLIVAAIVKFYLQQLQPEALRETMDGLVKEEVTEFVIDHEKLATVIDSAKFLAIVGMEEVGTEDADDFFRRSVVRFREETMPQLSGPEYIKTLPEVYEDFIIDCWKAVK